MPKSNNNRVILEEEVKNKVAATYFNGFDCTKIIGKIDFCVCIREANQTQSSEESIIKSLLWAEAKKGKQKNIYEAFIQLILTIGKARFFTVYLPPRFLGAFDEKTIAFISYEKIQEVFEKNDFNWNVTPSNHNTKEFKQLYEICKSNLKSESYIFDRKENEKELKKFIKTNFGVNSEFLTYISIDKSNFLFVYQRWCKKVKHSINVNWDEVENDKILDADFYLADLLSKDNKACIENLHVILRGDHYELDRKKDELGFDCLKQVRFNDSQEAHKLFWNPYERPPENKYWDYITDRRDLLVPSDIREIRGSYFTPQIWIKKSQEYLADVLGKNWQDEYYIWDCCAGTGNMEMGLTNSRNIWASTIDQADVDIMKATNKLNLFENHIFQFDFLNDDFSKCPEELQAILNDEEKRKRLIIYINPPYKEATSSKTISQENSRHRRNVAVSKVKEKYQKQLNQGTKELFIQFLTRIYFEIPSAFIANFSTLKSLQGIHCKEFRNIFLAKLEKLFIVPAATFDNVSGEFPIGFFIWNTKKNEKFSFISAEIFDSTNKYLGQKNIYVTPDKNIKTWLQEYKDKENENRIAYLVRGSADVQNNNIVYVTLSPSESVINASNASNITKNNLIENSIFLSVRKVIKNTWINNRDQYLYPKDEWKSDIDFQTDCLMFSLLDDSNNVKSKDGENHWIPFTEDQVGSKKEFQSHFMSDFIAGKIEILDKNDTPELPNLGEKKEKKKLGKITFSSEAQAVYNSGLELWKYYFSKNPKNHNASYYDIREYFQGRDNNGRMNNDSDDADYNQCISDLREKMKVLSRKIEEKVYEYEFLIK